MNCRRRHFSRRAKEAYRLWTRQFLFFHEKAVRWSWGRRTRKLSCTIWALIAAFASTGRV
jgi:hypothetical protein